MSSNMPVKEIGEMFDMISTKLPGLIKEIYNVLFSEEGANSMGKAVATFYKHLIDTGMNKDDAMKLTSDYMNTINAISSQFKA